MSGSPGHYGDTVAGRMIQQTHRDEMWRRCRRTCYMALAVIAVAALVWIAVK